jgi:thymidylate synthase
MSESKFSKIYSDLFYQGDEVRPRGQLVKEIENYGYTLGPYERFPSFLSRRLSVKYIKKEFLWYLKGDRFDTSICEHAKIWRDVVNKDGSINSNYGQYIFAGEDNQFDNVVRTLSKDKDSRRASISILSKDHLLSDTNDVPCTYSLNFRIRKNRLNMSVMMRSQDAVFGMGNDAPCFSFIHEMMFVVLKDTYPDLEYGNYFHHADSFHVYERHFELLQRIVLDGDPFVPVECPKISGIEEVNFLRKYASFTDEERKMVPKDLFKEEYEFTKWLLEIA